MISSLRYSSVTDNKKLSNAIYIIVLEKIYYNIKNDISLDIKRVKHIRSLFNHYNSETLILFLFKIIGRERFSFFKIIFFAFMDIWWTVVQANVIHLN